MIVSDHGIPVISSVQCVTSLAPNAAGTGWNYIMASDTGAVTDPVEWVVVKNLTTAPSPTIYTTPAHHYPTLSFRVNANVNNQLRAPNGRIFYLCVDNYIAYYDQSDEQIHMLPAIVETPAVDVNASTSPFWATFSTDGVLYGTTQESHFRPTCVFSVDPTTLAVNIISYPGSGALSYTTYGFRIVADTGTAVKGTWTVYGENPWQLWWTNISTGVSTKVYEVASTGNMQFVEIVVGGVSKGWTAIIDTDLGQPDNVRTQWWCLDGALYAYTAGQDPPVGAPATRVVTPASNPLVGAPQIDVSGGTGIVGYRASGSTSPYTYVTYTVNYSTPVAIESLVASNDGILGNAQSYLGVVRLHEPGDVREWYGAWTSGMSEGPRLNIGGFPYFSGYPNGILYKFKPTDVWNLGASPPVTSINPQFLGSYGQNGTLYAGIKYTRRLADAPLAGVAGRIYAGGDRERNGSGCGIGSWDKTSGAMAGVYSSSSGSTGPASMVSALCTGLLVDSGLGRVVMATRLISPPGDALLYVFDYAFGVVGTPVVLPTLSNLGQIFPTKTAHVICGVSQSPNGKLALYQYNIQTLSLVSYVETAIVGSPSGMVAHPTNGAVWVFVGNVLYQVDVDTLKVSPVLDVTGQLPVGVCSFAADNQTFFFAGGAPGGVAGSKLFSLSPSPPAASPRRLARRREYAP